MKKIQLALVGILATLLCSCGTYTYQESTARFVEPSRAGFISPVVADMQVSAEKIENAVEIEVVLKSRQINSIMLAEAQGRESALVLSWKKYALAQTLKKYNADDIVSPTFTIAPSPDKAGVLIVTVTGHTAVYQNFRTATQADIDKMVPFLEQKKDITVGGGLILQRYK